MRRARLPLWAVVGALLLTMVPVLSVQAAAPAQTYVVYRATCFEEAGPDFRAWETANGHVHLRDLVQVHHNFFLDDGAWVAGGTNTAVVRYDAGTASGTFQIRDSLAGDYGGSWRSPWSLAGQGATGQGVGAWSGSHLTVEFPPEAPSGLPAPPQDPCFGGAVLGFGYELWTVH